MHPVATLGFVDGTTLQNRPNHARMLATPEWTYVQGKGKRAQPLFGFMSINGNDCMQPVQQARTKDLMAFMQDIPLCNNDGRPIGIVLDNASIHKAKALVVLCCELEIHLIYLLPYSPDLNPIEYLWKDGKKELSKNRDFDQPKQKVPQVFLDFAIQRKHSYSSAWKRKFIHSIS